METAAKSYGDFLKACHKAAVDIMKTYKGGAFKDQVTDKATLTQIFDVLITSTLINGQEKTAFRLGRSLTEASNHLSMDEMRRRMVVYLQQVAPIFYNMPTGMGIPPVQKLNPDDSVAHTLRVQDDGSIVITEGGEPGSTVSIETGDDRPTLVTWPGQAPRPPLFDPEAGEKIEKVKAKKKASEKREHVVIPVHPSAILAFKDFFPVQPDEVDNYPLVMEWIWKQMSQHAKLFKKGAFKDRIKETMTMAKIFKLLIGSDLTIPAEKEVLRRGLEWIQYLENRFGGLVHLSRFHSMCYSGVFIEKVFCIFRNDEESGDKSTSTKPIWGLTQIDEGINDNITVGEDWGLVRTPRTKDSPFGGSQYLMKMTPEGADLVTPLGKLKSLNIKDGILQDKLPPKKPAKKNKESPENDLDIDDDAFEKIMLPWLGENSTRKRTRTGQYSMEEMLENARALQQTLGRVPTRDEIMMDMLGALTRDMAEKGIDAFKAEVVESKKKASK